MLNTLEDAFVEDKDHRISMLNQYKGTGIGLDNNLNSYRATKNKSIDFARNAGGNQDAGKGKSKSTYQSFISRWSFSRKQSANQQQSQERSTTPSQFQMINNQY